MLDIINKYVSETISLFLDMAPYLLLGFIIAGILHVYFPKKKVNRYMGGKNLFSVVNASLFGIPLPLCSCGVIPTGISFFRNGASKGSTVSFLISTPQTGVDSILVTYSLLGLPFAVIRPIVAFFTGIFGGLLTNTIEKKSEVVKMEEETEIKSTQSAIRRMVGYAFGEFLQDIQKWLVIGILLAGMIAVFVPDDFFAKHIGNSYLDMLIILVASVPLYVCATSSVPIAAALLLKGISPGAALVFLMAGPATNIATITVLGKILGRKSLIAYLISIIGGALLFGVLINEFLPSSWFSFPADGGHGHHQHHLLPGWLNVTSGIILALLLIRGFISAYFIKKPKQFVSINKEIKTMETIKVKVEGMTCNHCKMNVANSILKLGEVSAVDIDLTTGAVELNGENIDLDKVRDAVEAIGYDYRGKI